VLAGAVGYDRRLLRLMRVAGGSTSTAAAAAVRVDLRVTAAAAAGCALAAEAAVFVALAGVFVALAAAGCALAAEAAVFVALAGEAAVFVALADVVRVLVVVLIGEVSSGVARVTLRAGAVTAEFDGLADVADALGFGKVRARVAVVVRFLGVTATSSSCSSIESLLDASSSCSLPD
jgi:hypothetical protein